MDLPPPPPQLPPREGGLPYPPTPPQEKSDLPPKGPGSPGIILPRIAARIIDFLITTIPFGILAQPYVKTTGKTQSFDGPAWLVVASLITPLVYEILMTAWHGQTIGKMALRLQVVRYRDGGHVNLQASAIRAIGAGGADADRVRRPAPAVHRAGHVPDLPHRGDRPDLPRLGRQGRRHDRAPYEVMGTR